MSVSTQPYKGARDFYPEDMRVQRYIFTTMRTVVERYGYEEYDAPILEPTDLYLQKGNQEIIEQQTYTFTDRGDRSVTLRTEMTPSIARMVAGKRQELAYPLRWYAIPQCWRYERTQRGRGREFYQLNVDLFGEAGITAEHEMLILIRDLLEAYGATADMYTIRINSRAFMNWVFADYLKLSQQLQADLFRLIDRKQKIDKNKFDEQLTELLQETQDAESAVLTIKELLQADSLDTIPKPLREHDSLLALRELMNLSGASNIQNLVFDPTITRGFDYYNDIVFEVFDTHPDNNRSMFGGGRYDNLLESFGADPIPTIGFGMGDMTLINFLELHSLLPDNQPATLVYLVVYGDVYAQASAVTESLRSSGINVAVDATNRKMDKMIKAADKKQIPYILVIGEREITEGRFTLKRLADGKETQHTQQELVSTLVG
ncbi:MAG: histidine--tRNA ligase [Actinobacteria bacterium]|nr:histidine--tRNA ligase [Actinomycetota bacterium]